MPYIFARHNFFFCARCCLLSLRAGSFSTLALEHNTLILFGVFLLGLLKALAKTGSSLLKGLFKGLRVLGAQAL
jgi:hypothetical protein